MYLRDRLSATCWRVHEELRPLIHRRYWAIETLPPIQCEICRVDIVHASSVTSSDRIARRSRSLGQAQAELRIQKLEGLSNRRSGPNSQ